MATTITILGTGPVRPAIGGETASFVINDHILVDAGWCNVLHMRGFGLDPAKIDCLVMTHFHHDHYLGLPQLLFYLGSLKPERKLTIVGPGGDLEKVVDLALSFLQAERFTGVAPELELVPLKPGDRLETETFSLDTTLAIHPVPALSYRFRDHESGTIFAFTGDTGYNPELVEFCRGCALLIHEASYAGKPAPADDRWGHSGAYDAAVIASTAEVPHLVLLHCDPAKQREAVEAAKALHPNVTYPEEGQRFELQ